MKRKRVLTGGLVWLAVLGFCLPQPMQAAEAPIDPAPVVIDVALADGGLLIGQVVDPQGSALPKVPVSLRNGNRQIAAAETDANGQFAVRGIPGGVYQAVAAGGHATFRLWAPGTAPPSSRRSLLLIAGQRAVRGQCSEPGCGECGECDEPPCEPRCGRLAFLLANPWVVAGIVATAVAVPVAIHNSDRPSSP